MRKRLHLRFSMRRAAATLALALCSASLATASYHFVHYTSLAPNTPVFERFAIESLPDGVVPFLVEDQATAIAYAKGDSFATLLAQIRAAAESWNAQPGSRFRYRFGGVSAAGATMSTPAVRVSFDELAPGVLAMSGPVTRGEMVVPDTTGETKAKPYVPILQSALILPLNLRAASDDGHGPVWSDRLFLTMVHEFGHALGLQHSWTGGAMSTEVTRTTSRARPLAMDDVIGLAMLYPVDGWDAKLCAISGRVAVGNNGVALASVVALTASGEAVSTLTNPDGSYRIEGLAPGTYWVYAHTVPNSGSSDAPSGSGQYSAVNLVLPIGAHGTIAPGTAFNTIFQTGTTDPGKGIAIEAGMEATDVNFAVSARNSISIYDITTYNYYWNDAAQDWDIAKPALFQLGDKEPCPVGASGPCGVLTGHGVLASDGKSPARGLSASILGAPDMLIGNTMKANPYGPGYLEFDLNLASQTTAGPRHMLLSVNGESHVLPTALRLSAAAPPVIKSVADNGDGTATVVGTGLGVGTRIVFGGVAAATRQAESGKLVVTPPPALDATLEGAVALNPDGLSSSFFIAAGAPPAITAVKAQAPVLTLQPSFVPVGSDVTFDLTGSDIDFATANLQIGFGTSDIVVRKVWVLSAQHVVVQASILATAQTGAVPLTVSTGLQLARSASALTLLPASSAAVASQSANQTEPVVAGRTLETPFLVAVSAADLNAVASDFALVLNNAGAEFTARVIAFADGQLLVSLPAQLQPGPLVFRLSYRGVASLPFAIEVVGAVPSLLQVRDAETGVAISAANPAADGAVLEASVALSTVPVLPLDVFNFTVSAGEQSQTVLAVLSTSDDKTLRVRFIYRAPASLPDNLVLPLVLNMSGVSTASLPLNVAPASVASTTAE